MLKTWNCLQSSLKDSLNHFCFQNIGKINVSLPNLLSKPNILMRTQKWVTINIVTKYFELGAICSFAIGKVFMGDVFHM